MRTRTGPLGHYDLDESEDALPVSEQIVGALMANSGKVLDLFISWDSDGSGTISRKEFHRSMGELGLEVPPASVDEIFSGWDRDGSGTITLKELTTTLQAASTASRSIVAMRKLLTKKGLKSQLAQAFRTWDKSGDGALDLEEFGKALNGVGLILPTAQVRALFQSIDRDGGGSISFKEFNKVVRLDAEREEAERKQREDRRRRAAYERKEDILDVGELRGSTLSKLAFDVVPAADAAAAAEADGSPLYDSGGPMQAVDSAQQTVATAIVDGRFPPANASAAGTTYSKEAERTRRQMRLRLRGTGLEGSAEVRAREPRGPHERPHEQGWAQQGVVIDDERSPDSTLTMILRRLPRGSPQRQAFGTEERHLKPAASRSYSYSTSPYRTQAVYKADTVTRQCRRPVLREGPGALPRLIDVLSAHRMRAAVPDSIVASLPTFNLCSLPPLRQDDAPRAGWASAGVDGVTALRISTSLPALPALGTHVAARGEARRERKLRRQWQQQQQQLQRDPEAA